jgi:hypothetical protein
MEHSQVVESVSLSCPVCAFACANHYALRFHIMRTPCGEATDMELFKTVEEILSQVARDVKPCAFPVRWLEEEFDWDDAGVVSYRYRNL